MRYLKYITAVVAGVSLVGCSSFLEENPDQRTTLDSAEKIKELLVFAYPQTNNYYPLETMSDNVGDSKRTQDTKVDNVAYYAWEVEQQEEADSPGAYWESAYKAISQANHALEAIEKIKSTTSKENYEGIKGEALIARAYAHWMLAMTFCETYDPNTAGSKLGVPYVNEIEDVLIKDYERGTLEEVYSNIEADLVEGLALIKGESFYQSPKYHFTKDAAYAFAARFYAFKADWSKVMEYTNFIGDWPTTLRDYNQVVPGGNSQIMQAYSDVKEKANLLIAGTNSTLIRSYSENRFGYTRNEVNQTVWSQKYNPFKRDWSYSLLTSNQELVYMARFHEYFVYSNQSAGIGYPYQNVVLFTTDETYLYRIEATIMSGDYEKAAQMMAFFTKPKSSGGGGDHTKITAASLLNTVRNADEYQPFYQLTDTERRLTKYLAELRRIEFLQVGNRWYDIKRYNLEVKHSYLIEGKTEVLTANDLRKAIQLPQSALAAGLTPNPR